jgi:hypothetical protein
MPLHRRSLTGAALTAVLAVAASGGIPVLAPWVPYPLGPEGCESDFNCSSDPQGLVLVDVDGDGDIDVVTANNGSDDATVFLNDGAGAFTVSATFPVGSAPAHIAAADFDGDGIADLAVVSAADSTVAILLGGGDGTFASADEFAVGIFPVKVVAADFDGDGAADFATSDLFGDTVTVRLGRGDGTFADAATVPVPFGPVGLAVGDFNRDGSPDMVVTLEADIPGAVAVLLGDGTGGFDVQESPLIAGDTPLSVAVGDLDGDGADDLAVSNWADDTISVFFGNGDGTFDDGPVLDAGLVPEDVAIADLDGDGAADIITLDGFGSETSDGLLIVIPGVGDGTFDRAVAFSVGAAPRAVAVGDLDLDGEPDVTTADFDSDDIAIVLNLGGTAGDCPGDCNRDGMVSISELITGVNIALGSRPVADCSALDRDGGGTVSVAELIAAVNRALSGCGVG